MTIRLIVMELGRFTLLPKISDIFAKLGLRNLETLNAPELNHALMPFETGPTTITITGSAR